jgi:predicted ABC-type transport system involved in lysophospholipase L1 biosynthesis ATPase subunit
MGTIIKTLGLCRDFRVGSQTIHAIKNVSLDIKEGSLTILKGRSGSGKTTLINLLSVIDKPTSGSIFLQDKNTGEMGEEEKDSVRRSVYGFVFQSGALVPNMTVYENVELVLRLSKVPQKNWKAMVEESISQVGLIKKVHRTAKHAAKTMIGRNRSLGRAVRRCSPASSAEICPGAMFQPRCIYLVFSRYSAYLGKTTPSSPLSMESRIILNTLPSEVTKNAAHALFPPIQACCT